MGAAPPVNHESLAHKGERMVEAHRYFTDQARQWLTAGGAEGVEARASAIDATVRDLLQMVVIDLGADENAQEIFETLNARGAQLTAADLIKNFIFQQLLEDGADVEAAYQRHWKDFETAFWETETSVGRLRHRRSSIFLNHWLVARKGEDIVASKVFFEFKKFAVDSEMSMPTVLEQVHRASSVYHQFLMTSKVTNGAVDRLLCSATEPACSKAKSSSHWSSTCSIPSSRVFRSNSSRRHSTPSRAGWSGECSCGQQPRHTTRSSPSSLPS
jgi:hypothetical protein